MNLSFGNLITWLHHASKSYFRSQVCCFEVLFASYCAHMRATTDPSWMPNQGEISNLYNQKSKMIKGLRQYYIIDNPSKLKADVQQYLCIVASTAREREYYYNHLLTIITNAHNLHADDRATILLTNEYNIDHALVEMLYRALRTMLCYSSVQD